MWIYFRYYNRMLGHKEMKGDILFYRCIKCGGFGLRHINKFYYQCVDRLCEQVHELDDLGKTIQVYKPITFLTPEQENECLNGD